MLPTNSLKIPTRWLDCGLDRFELEVRGYKHERPDGRRVNLPRVNFLRCVECGEEMMTTEGNNYVVDSGGRG